MYTYRVLIAVSGNRGVTQWVQLQAGNDHVAKQIAASLYGEGNVLNYTRVSP